MTSEILVRLRQTFDGPSTLEERVEQLEEVVRGPEGPEQLSHTVSQLAGRVDALEEALLSLSRHMDG